MASKATTLVSLVLVAIITQGTQASPMCPAGEGMSWMADPDDCAKFYVCHASQRFEFTCGINVWDQETKTCVGKGSQWDKCTISKELDELNDRVGTSSSDLCTGSRSTAIFAKSDNCAQYLDCSAREATVSVNPHVVECEFPFLFDPDTKRCQRFETVKCGQRWEPLDACDYVANTCRGRVHCVPCQVRFPSCRGQPDGLNPWVGREYSPYFVLCEKERVLYHGQCDNTQGTQLFDAEKRICAPMAKEE